jgi:hypothetical protein
MTTTWLPHLTTNTLSLLLPDIYRLLVPLTHSRRRTADHPQSLIGEMVHVVGETLAAILRDNPRYVLYVTPLALGYLLSAPWLNIYKGELAEKRLGGFGLDALPHGLTAFALTALARNTITTFAELSSATQSLQGLGGALARNRTPLSALALALATLLWELGEHRIYRYELAQRGSPKRINMQWSPSDTAYDCAANAIGWLLATAWGRYANADVKLHACT